MIQVSHKLLSINFPSKLMVYSSKKCNFLIRRVFPSHRACSCMYTGAHRQAAPLGRLRGGRRSCARGEAARATVLARTCRCRGETSDDLFAFVSAFLLAGPGGLSDSS